MYTYNWSKKRNRSPTVLLPFRPQCEGTNGSKWYREKHALCVCMCVCVCVCICLCTLDDVKHNWTWLVTYWLIPTKESWPVVIGLSQLASGQTDKLHGLSWPSHSSVQLLCCGWSMCKSTLFLSLHLRLPQLTGPFLMTFMRTLHGQWLAEWAWSSQEGQSVFTRSRPPSLVVNTTTPNNKRGRTFLVALSLELLERATITHHQTGVGNGPVWCWPPCISVRMCVVLHARIHVKSVVQMNRD